MSKTFLITRPKHDHTTHYLFNWAKAIIELAKSKSIEVLDLSGSRANKKEFTGVVFKKQPLFIFFNGHGNKNLICGHDDEVLVRADDNESLLKDKIVYALSCSAGMKLGPRSIKSGALSFVGYKEDFIFFYDDTKVNKPLSDSTARLFLYPSNYVAHSLIKGHTVGESCKRSREQFMKSIQKVATEESDSYLLPYLAWDMKHQVCLGSQGASF